MLWLGMFPLSLTSIADLTFSVRGFEVREKSRKANTKCWDI